ncbi:MAG TPA: TRAP transporter large permease subunit [Candidatus Sulfotelmatobacter sp.]|nr:TRAP transporter large permease subunit [Candidatus Sulfotelmatobacter sp.]
MKSAPGSLGQRLLEGSAALLLVAMTLIVATEVFCRYVLNSSLPWSEELSRYLFIWMSFLGAVVALLRHAHIGVDSLVRRLGDAPRLALHRLVAVLVAAFALLLVWQGAALLPATRAQYSITMGFSLSYVFCAVPICGALLLAIQMRRLAAERAPAVILGLGAAVAAAGALFLVASRLQIPPGVLAVILVVALVVLIAIHTPIAFAVGLACVAYLVLKRDIPLIVVAHRVIGGMDSFLLLAIPLFILCGELMNTGGVTERLVGFARALVGRIHGGLGIATVIGEYFFSGISGSSVADVSAMGSLLIPAMQRAGYRSEAAVSIVASASAMGMLVPPCIPMVVLASITGLSVAALFMAGFLPAACIAVLLMGLIYIEARRARLAREPAQGARALLRALARSLLPLFTAVIILGGILGGVVTPTEAAVLGVLYALALGLFVYREIRLRDMLPMLVNTASLTGMIMLLVGTASLLSWIFAAEGIPLMVSGWMLALSTHPAPFLITTILVFVVLGAVLEGLPALIILTPIVFPIASRFGLDLLHYGTVVIAALGVGLFLPPFGLGFFIACGLGKVNVESAARSYVPYLIVLFLGLLVVAFVPWITLVLPRFMRL